MRRISSTAAFALGVGAMYLLDPDRGRRRRSLLRDKIISAGSQADDVIYKTVRDLNHRIRGLVASSTSIYRHRPVSDSILEARIRSRIGRVVSHPHAIEVRAHHGHATLRGPILAHEVKPLNDAVSRIPGVIAIDSQLEAHKTSNDIPSLQGGAARYPQQFELAQANWAPAVRFLADAVGVGLISYALRHRNLIGGMAGIAGIALLLRATTNLEIKRITGIGAGRRAVDIRKTLNIRAPLEEVFAFWSHYDNFPRFMPHLREVRDLGGGRSHWVVSGPLGLSFEWDAIVTEFIPNEVIAWKTENAAVVDHAGIIRFDRNPDGTTRVDIRLSYNPMMGAIGHVVASIFGSDPKHIMDDDLIRFKSLLEHGKATAGGKTVMRDEMPV